jgi:glycerol-3-phosphate acyltransferase PlsX
MPVRVAVDAMGGDHAPAVVVDGCVEAARALGPDVEILLAGPAGDIEPMLRERDAGGLSIRVLDAPDVIAMAESPSTALKSKPRSSIHVGLAACRSGEADAFVSAGNTGAVLAASVVVLGRLAGVSRPAIIGYYPTIRSFALVIDVGTNVDCKPEQLVQFAQMASIYAERVLHREHPVVGLMNVGEEPGKGNDQAKAAYPLLESAPGIRFRGNIEGRDIMQHAADVVVCDGFVGNIMLKLGESIATEVPRMIAGEMARQQMSEEEKAAVVRALKGVASRFDYQEYGGVPLLGVNGNVIIGHGGSSARAIRRMVEVAADLVREDVAGLITAAMQPSGTPA